MPVSAADVRNVAFNAPPMGRRGYDAADVDAFLDEVERELVRLVEENDNLRSRVECGASGVPADPAADPRLAAELGRLKAQLDRVQREKAAAEQAARTRRAELEQVRSRDAPVMGGDGGQQALRLLTMAQRTADNHLGDARRMADKLLSDARRTAEQATRQAQATADALEQDVRHHQQEAMAGLDDNITAAQTQIGDLKEFERTHRSRLKAYLEGRLLELTRRGPDPETQTSQADGNQSEGSTGATTDPSPAVDPVP